METFLHFLRTKFKNSPVVWIISLIVIVFSGLSLTSLISDLGFSEEITKYRYYVLPVNLIFGSIIVFFWFVIDLIYESVSLKEKVSELEGKEKLLLSSRQVILSLLEEVTKGRKFEITKVQLYNNSIYLILSKKKTQTLIIGDEIKVFDTSDGSIMGTFEICENNQTDFRVKVGDYINPVWAGYIHSTGNGESFSPPNTIAILFSRGS